MACGKLLVASFVLLAVEFGCCTPRFHHGRWRGQLLKPPQVPPNQILPPDQWVETKLDHFNEADTRTWKQRYFVNDTFHKPGGPVFLMIGGEGEASPEWMVTGAWIDYAQKYNALCLQLEHRFYGKSQPTKDMGTDNLAYLSSEQGLADLAYFRNYAVQLFKLTEANKWIAFGGSYPGGLSAWFRLKYPHLVDGSVATSAPLFAEINFKEYLGVVRDSLATTGEGCNAAIQNATATLESLLLTDAGRKNIQEMFQLCDPIDVKNANDIANLFQTFAGNFEGVVQYNKDNRAFEVSIEGAVGTNVTIDTICGIMTNGNGGTPVERYAQVNALILKTYDQKCTDYKYDSMIKTLRQTDWKSSAAEGGRQWIYQTCTEFGYYQSSDLSTQPFGHNFPVKFSVQQCQAIYGDKFTEQLLENAIHRTNTNYGGYGIKVTKVVFPNGSIDPWHVLGITKDISPEATAIYIQGTAHCANMYPESPDDPPQLTQARQHIQELIGQWLQS